MGRRMILWVAVVATAGAAPAAAADPAAQLLRRAKLFAEGEDSRSAYVAKLRDIVAKYPDTAAGKEARKRLDRLQLAGRRGGAPPSPAMRPAGPHQAITPGGRLSAVPAAQFVVRPALKIT